MATIITRETGATAVNRTLTNTELDNNFINLNADIATRIPSSEKAAANGVATLDATGKVPSTQLPSYVDDVLEAANLAAFPATGETGKIYVALDTNKAYRWSGSTYIYITSGAVDSVAGRTGAIVLTKSDVGLSNVDNTADADKNVLTATKWAAARTLSITGDISGNASMDGSANATITATLPATGVTAGSYGSATAIPVITVDAKGRLTLVSTVAVSIPSGSISVTGGDFTLSGSTGSPITNATLATVNSNVGTFNNVTVNAKGLVTSASNVNYLTSYTETDTLATVTSRGNSTSTNIGSTSGSALVLATAGNIGTWIGGIADGTSGWALSQASIGFKSDNNTYAAIGIGTSNGILYFGRTTASGVGTMSSWLEVDAGGVANFKRARPQWNGSGLALVSEIPSLAGYLTAESDTLATVTARGATTSTPTTFSGRLTATSQQVVGAQRRYYIGTLGASGTQARRFEIARVYIDYNDWHGAGTIRVELHNQYFIGGDRQVWNISYDYNNISCDLVESIGPRGRYATVTCGSATQISGDYYYLPIYVDVRYYATYSTYLTTSWPETTAHQADSGAILVYSSPSGSDIGDFTPSDAMSFRASSLSLSGNAVLHASNYSSYALPLTGGTLTGKLTVTAAAGLDLYRLTFDADGSDSWYRATSGNRHRFTTTGGADFIIGNGTGVATLNGYQLLTAGNYTDYKPTVLVSPNGPTVVSADSAFPAAGQTFQHSLATGPDGNDGHILAMSWANTASIYGAQIWLDTDPTNRMAIRSRNSSGTWNGWSEVLTANNYNNYAPTLTGGNASGTWSINITGSLTASAPQLAAATESNSIYISAPSYTTGSPVKLLNFDWYGNTWAIGNIRSGATPSDGFGVYFQGSERGRWSSTGFGFQVGTAIGYDNSGGWGSNIVVAGTYHARFRLRATSYNGSGDRETYLWLDNTVNPATGLYSSAGTFNFNGSIATVQVAGNTVLHAGNYTNYTLPLGGSWYGSGLPGSRWYGLSVSGGEIVFANGLPNAGQMGILVDGCYVAGENNGFWSMGSDNSWGSRRGMYWDGSYLNFTTNTPTARFQNTLVDGVQYLSNGNCYISQADSSLRVNTAYGYIDIGPKNSSWCHIYSDKNIYTNVGIWINNNRVLDAGNYTGYDGIVRALGYISSSNDWNSLGNSYHNSVLQVDPSNFSSTSNGPTAASYTYGTLLNLASNSSSKSQIYISHAGNDLIFRGGWGTGSWQTWNKVLTNQNYNSYSPTLTGGNASGTWSISITGSAGSAGNATTADKVNSQGGYPHPGTGMYAFYNWGGSNGGASAPSGSSYTIGISVGSHPSDQSYGFQIARNMWNTGLWTRGYDSGYGSWVRLLDSSNYTDYAASSGHNHTYNVNNEWLRDNGDDNQFKIYGNSRTLIYRTDGNTNDHGGGAYAHIFYYGGSADSNRKFIINTDGNIWNSYSGVWWSDWLNQAVRTDSGPTFADVYTNGWFRNNNSGQGLYNQATGNHFYSDGSYWNVGYSGTNGIRLRNGHAGTVLGYLYAETSQNMGLLNSYGSWAVQVYPGTQGGGYLHGNWSGANIRANRANGNLYIDDNYGNTVVGVYSSYRYQGVFAMGDSYKLPADGTTTGSLYGLAWSHPNAGGTAGNLTNHGLLVLINGGFAAAISDSIVTSGAVTAYSDERLKTNWQAMPENYVARLAQVRVGIYDRIDSGARQVGVGAQSFRELLPEAILEAKDDIKTLSVSYGNAALASAVELAKEVVTLQARIEKLERIIQKLIEE